jgi:hypothetical protein
MDQRREFVRLAILVEAVLRMLKPDFDILGSDVGRCLGAQ